MIHSRAPAARVRRTPREARPRAVGASSRCVSQKARAQACMRARGASEAATRHGAPTKGFGTRGRAPSPSPRARCPPSRSIGPLPALACARVASSGRKGRSQMTSQMARFLFSSLCLTFSFCTPARRARARHGLRARRARGHEHHLQAAQARGRLPRGVCGGAHRLTQKHARQPLRRARRGRRRGQRGAAGGKRGGKRRAGPARARGGRGGRRRRRCAWEPLGARKAGEARA